MINSPHIRAPLGIGRSSSASGAEAKEKISTEHEQGGKVEHAIPESEGKICRGCGSCVPKVLTIRNIFFLNPGGERMMRKNEVGQETDIKAQQGFLQNNN